MRINDLVIIHRPKLEGVSGLRYVHEGVMTLETCLRYVYVGFLKPEPSCLKSYDELLTGIDAYQFLLEMACGLKSEMPAEPEVFGQLKKQWAVFQKEQPQSEEALRPIMQVLFKDTKRVRKDFLQGIAGASYYSATDKLINLKRNDKVLVIGAGQFGNMLVQTFSKRTNSLYLMNRHEDTYAAWQDKWKDAVEYLPYMQNIEQVMHDMDHVLVAVPAKKDHELDQALMQSWIKREEERQSGYLVHYCEAITKECVWQDLPRFVDLATVMEKAENHGVQQSQQLERAYGEVARRANKLQAELQPRCGLEIPRDNSAVL